MNWNLFYDINPTFLRCYRFCVTGLLVGAVIMGG